MNDRELRALRHCAEGAVLFHNGLWGAPMGYLWAGADGCAAGHVPQWEAEALALLERRGLVAVRPGPGTRDTPVEVTDRGAQWLEVAA
ncbi:hypothetical protein [Actinokineospora sp. HUAS TT18]|uniref:hypothetical protein n=1 Tax=Actinokineospora sp. HUAS TT18 TaxID=3447451 RepID=UPI003F51F1DC